MQVLIADLQAKGGPAKFDGAKYRESLIAEYVSCAPLLDARRAERRRARVGNRINDARTQPKVFVKKLMKLKTCYTGKDFIPPSRPQTCIATKEGVKSVTDAIM